MLSVMCAAKIDEKKSPTVAEKKKQFIRVFRENFQSFTSIYNKMECV